MKLSTLGAILLLVLTALVMIGCGGSAAANSQPVETDRVEMPPSYKFEPQVIQVPVGTTVTWHNSDHFSHTVQLLDGSGRDPVAAPGESVTIAFDKAGEYDYTCRFHPKDMRGKVIVVAN